MRPTPASIRWLAALPPALVAAVVRMGLLSSRSLRTFAVATGVASADEGRALAEEMLADARAHGAARPVLEALLAAASG